MLLFCDYICLRNTINESDVKHKYKKIVFSEIIFIDGSIFIVQF